LVLNRPESKIGILIWDLNDAEKASVAKILKGLVPSSHPLRQFIEKDIT